MVAAGGIVDSRHLSWHLLLTRILPTPTMSSKPSSGPQLPGAFTELSHVREGRHKAYSFVSVIGMVTDFLPPRTTSGSGRRP